MKQVAHAVQKKLLPDGIPPPQPIPLNIKAAALPNPGQRQILRVNQACKTCRRQKMRCEGPENPPCSRCKLAGTECIFEKVTKGELEVMGGQERMRELESQMDSLRATQEQMQDTLREILSHVRAPPASEPRKLGEASSASKYDEPWDPTSNHHIKDDHHPQQPSQSFAGSSTNLLPPLQTVIAPEPQSPYSGYSASTSHHAAGSTYGVSDPSNSTSIRLTAPHRPQNQTETTSPGGFEGHTNGQDSTSLRRPAETEPPADAPEAKRRRKNDIRSLLDDSAGTAWGTGTQAPRDTPVHEVRVPNVIEKGIINENDARTLWDLYFEGCQLNLPLFDPRTDNFESFRHRSSICFCCILMVASKISDGGEEPSPLSKALYKEALELSKESMFQAVDGVEKVQAMLIIAAWSRSSGGTGWLAAGHAIRFAVELGLHRSVPRLTRLLTESADTDDEENKTILSAARVWCALYVFEYQICLGTGRHPMTGGRSTVEGVRHVFLNHPLALPTDMRTASACELYSLIAVYLETVGLLETEVNSITQALKAGTALRDVSGKIETWYQEWEEIMNRQPRFLKSFLVSLQIQRSFAFLTVNAALMRKLHTTSDMESVSPEMKKVILRATKAAQECIELCISSKDYTDFIRYGITHTHSSFGFAGLFLVRMCRLFPDAVELSHVTSLIESLIEILSRNHAGIFVQRLRTFLGSINATAAPAPVHTWQTYNFPPSAFTPAVEAAFCDTAHNPHQTHGALDIYAPQHVAPQNTISYQGWAVSGLQMSGNVPQPIDFIRAQFAGEL